MKKNTIIIGLAVLLGGSSMFMNDDLLHANDKQNDAHEKEDDGDDAKHVNYSYPWGEPGEVSTTLQPGSPSKAGMREEPIQEIDGVLSDMIRKDVMPGAVALVARRGHIVKQSAYGYAAHYMDDNKNEMENPVDMQRNTIFDLASISKIFTTTAAMKLYEEGYFQLDEPVATYIPEFAENGKEDVTIRQLMTHTSGFTAWIPLYKQGDDREERFQIVFQYPLKNEPGTTYTYSDLNMITLGALVERLSGKRLDHYVKENITGPLGMEDTMYNPPNSLKERIAATEYQPWTGRGLVWGEVHDENAWSLDGVAGHAGVFSTAEDLARLAHMYVNEGRYGSEQILNPETVKLLVENQNEAFPGDEHGLGWEIQQGWFMDALSSKSTVGHTGYTGTSVVVDLRNATVAILLTNRVHPTRETVSTNPARRQFARKVAEAIPVRIPNSKKSWFSGYGDGVERSLTAEVDADENATLTFNTWYQMEEGYDFGRIDVSEDGEKWTPIHQELTGNSNWTEMEIHIPEDTEYVRFTYQTDGSTNGRGWYLNDIKVMDEEGEREDLEVTFKEWTLRTY